MSAHRMKFPAVPGKTPREQFENLVRHVMSVPKADIPGAKAKPSKAHDSRQRRRALKPGKR